MQGENVTVFKAESDSGDAIYEVRFYEAGHTECSCPAGTFRSEDCKHVRRLKYAGAAYQGGGDSLRVFQVTAGNSSVVVTEEEIDDFLDRVLDNLTKDREVAVKRLA